MDNEEFGLSGNALEALKAFAQENNLKVGDEDDIVSGIQKALNIETDKKYTNLNYNYKDNKNNIHISLKSIDQEYGQQLQSTGLTVWRAAEELAHYIFSRRSLFQGKSVIELGAGLGLDGVLLACVNKEGYVNITDGDEENGNTLQLLEENLKTNSHLLKLKNTHVQRLWWGNDDEINKALANLKQHNQQEGQESNEEGQSFGIHC
ncbi:hypothetical protein PPERSA_04133 [Pseudocohnilembus persalinus]|uniref:Uncharacterized protein n=1 Tax=Pseudocohnilembus persalinus TaxID=266149 RepID=A0A0V0QMX4_PSEPJ|nr:hypothetical protein PPERSA_04133 [Pseudocohnilembus persalinus]|eukprot:KRX03581.1 hypothetical protein PPERSA_04133 [Pseudocohnilembus persalinus]